MWHISNYSQTSFYLKPTFSLTLNSAGREYNKDPACRLTFKTSLLISSDATFLVSHS